CELRPEVFSRWLAFDPARRVASHAAALHALKLLFLDCGTRDEYHLQFGARQFVRACRELGVPVEHEEYDDTHLGTSYRLDVSIPRILRALTPAGPRA